MSIVRVGLSETVRYGDGWSAVFKKSAGGAKKSAATKKARPAKPNGKKRKK